MVWFKKAWKLIVDQWLFFLAALVGIVGLVIGSRDNSKVKEVLDLKNKGEAEEREAQEKAREETEAILKKMDEDLADLDDEKRKAVEKVREDNKEEFEKQVVENRDKSLNDIAEELAKKHGLNKV
mgnify:CR=1 FL=1